MRDVIDRAMNSNLLQNIRKDNLRPLVCALKLKITQNTQQDNDLKHTWKSISKSEWFKKQNESSGVI